MIFNDGSQYRVLADVDAYRAAGRTMYAYRVASARGGQMYVDLAYPGHRYRTRGLAATVLYQFTWANISPEAQANYFLSALGGGLQQQEMVCLDLETGGGFNSSNVRQFAEAWLGIVEPALQTKAWLYIPGALASPLSGPLSAERVVWAPRYSGTASRGTQPGWRHDVHQYTDKGEFPGCSQTGDLSFTDLTTEAMLARCNPSGFPEPRHGGPPE